MDKGISSLREVMIVETPLSGTNNIMKPINTFDSNKKLVSSKNLDLVHLPFL